MMAHDGFRTRVSSGSRTLQNSFGRLIDKDDIESGLDHLDTRTKALKLKLVHDTRNHYS